MHNPRYLRDHLGVDRTPDIGDLTAYGKAILTIVGADGQVSGRELVYFMEHIQNMGFPEEVIEELKHFDYRNARLEDFVAAVKQGGAAMMLLYDAISASYQDGYSEKERESTAVAANLLGVEPTVRAALENLVAIDQAVKRGRDTENFPMVEDAVRTARMALITPQQPEFRVDEVAQASRPAVPMPGRTDRSKVPATLTRAVRSFAGAMLQLEAQVEGGELQGAKAAQAVTSACGGMLQALVDALDERPEDAATVGTYALRETFPWFMLSSFCDRAYTKPRGFAGDYETLELAYANEPAGDGALGALVDAWALNLPSVQALRAGPLQLSAAMDAELKAWPEPEAMPVTCLASGAAREIFAQFEGQSRPHANITCIDVDPQANSFATRNAFQAGALGSVFFVQDNLLEMAVGRGRTVLPQQRLITCAGFLDYLTDQQAVLLLNWIYGRLLPGGRLVLTQTANGAPDQAFLTHILEWGLYPRAAEAVEAMFERSKFGHLPLDLETDPTGVLRIVSCRKTI